MISLIGKLDRKVDWVEMYMERMIGSLGKLGRKVDIGRKMNDPDGALDPWSCFISLSFPKMYSYLILFSSISGTKLFITSHWNK